VSQQPSLGRIVLAVGTQATSNGTDVAPALITRVWGENPDGSWTVNMTVFPDAGSPVNATSVKVFADEEAARAALPFPTATAAYWPPRVG
jgi:hypothetical protein